MSKYTVYLYSIRGGLFEAEELSTKVAVRHTRRGELVYIAPRYDERPGRSLMIAMLLADDRDTYVIPLLNRACMREIRDDFIIEGTKINPRGRGVKNIKSDN